MIEKFKFILFESLQSFKRYPIYSFVSSLTIMICLILLSFIIYLSNITNNISENFKDNEAVIKIFIKSSVNQKEAKLLCETIKQDFNFSTIKFNNKNELFKPVDPNLKVWLGNDIDFLPCLCSANLDIQQIDEIDSLVSQIYEKYKNSIEQIVSPQSYLFKFEKISLNIYSFIIMLGILLVIISIFNVSNIIRLSVDSRKDVIEILKLHGAKKQFIKAPFILEGLMHGFIGACFSVLIILVIFNAISFSHYNHFLIKSLTSTISINSYIFFNLIFCVILGFIGSNLGTSNYLE